MWGPTLVGPRSALLHADLHVRIRPTALEPDAALTRGIVRLNPDDVLARRAEARRRGHLAVFAADRRARVLESSRARPPEICHPGRHPDSPLTPPRGSAPGIYLVR